MFIGGVILGIFIGAIIGFIITTLAVSSKNAELMDEEGKE